MSALRGVVVGNVRLKGAYWLLEIAVDRGFDDPVPGRFVMLKVGTTGDPLLRRPFGIHDIGRDASGRTVLKLLYRVCGRGTTIMTGLGVGAPADILGPLGNGFDLERVAGRPLIVGGGIGAAPLLYLARKMVERKLVPTVYLGGGGADDILASGAFEALGLDVRTATMDGSVGIRGTVIEALDREVRDAECTLLSCGPWPMHEAQAALCRRRGWMMQASVDARMACGMGLCLGCAVTAAPGKEKTNLMTCADGPVFSLEDLAWTDQTFR